MNILHYYLGFSHFLGIGPVRFAKLMEVFGEVKKAYEASEVELGEVIGKNLAQKFVHFRGEFDPVKKEEELKKKGIKIVARYSSYYPSSLKNISDPPICLYVKGDVNVLCNFQKNLPEISPRVNSVEVTLTSDIPSRRNFDLPSLIFFAIVGTRKPTPYGEQVAEKFAFELASAGFVIVSGMAVGVDAAAHWGALEAKGKTIAVLGCGVDIIYPAVNRRLYEKIIDDGGAVISEFPPGQMVTKGLFIARNRIISGLSAGVLVVEGTKDSGALITARYAAEQGKDVFAPPAPITSEVSAAPNLLLKEGAKLVISVEDIYEELGVKVLPKKEKEIKNQLSSAEKIIFEILEKEPMVIDELAIKIGQPVNQVLNTISLLEIKGVVERNREGRYQVTS